jgi:hypothetical protein
VLKTILIIYILICYFTAAVYLGNKENEKSLLNNLYFFEANNGLALKIMFILSPIIIAIYLLIKILKKIKTIL